MLLAATVLLQMPVAYDHVRYGGRGGRERGGWRGGGGEKGGKMQWMTKYVHINIYTKITFPLSYLEREHRTCSNGIERRLWVSAASRRSEVTRNQIRNKCKANKKKRKEIKQRRAHSWS